MGATSAASVICSTVTASKPRAVNRSRAVRRMARRVASFLRVRLPPEVPGVLVMPAIVRTPASPPAPFAEFSRVPRRSRSLSDVGRVVAWGHVLGCAPVR